MPDARYDFSNPFCAVAITKPDGTQVVFWTKTGYAPLPSLAIASEVTVEINMGHMPKIEVVLTPPLQDFFTILDDALIEWGNSLLSVQLGYMSSGGPVSPEVYSGLLMQPVIDVSNTPSITLNASGIGGFAAQRTAHNTATFLPLKGTIVALLADINKGMPSRFQLTLDWSLTTGTPEEKILLKPAQEDRHAGGLAQWFYLKNLLWEAQCTFIQKGAVIQILPHSVWVLGKPKHQFAYFPGAFIDSATTATTGIFPILTASTPNLPALLLPGIGALGIGLRALSPQTGKPVFKLVGDKEAAPARTAAQPTQGPDAMTAPAATDPATATQASPGQHHDDPDSDSADSLMKAAYTAAITDMGVTVEIETIGVPTLLPGQVVQLRGLGQRITPDSAKAGPASNNFAVQKTKHQVGLTGYSTWFTALSNVNGFFDNVHLPTGPTNTSTEATDSPDTTPVQPVTGN